MPNYLSLVWYSIGLTLVLCVAMSAFVIVNFAPLQVMTSEVARVRAIFQNAHFVTRWVAWLGFTVQLSLTILGICALAVSFAGMCAAAIHAILNFLARASHAELIPLINDELASGALPLRLASIAVVWTWMWMLRAHFQRMPKPYELDDYHGDSQHYLGKLLEIWEFKHNNQRTLFASDNIARRELKELSFRMPPATIFFYHTLHLGLISLAVAYTWILLAEGPRNFGLKGLAWLSLFAAHDVGLVFGYVYLLKGRMLGFHRLRIYSSASALSILMLVIAYQYLRPLQLNFGLALVALSLLATLLLIGIIIFEFLVKIDPQTVSRL